MDDNKNEYPLTFDHVRKFLATKGEDEELGQCGKALNCLLSNILDWLYPEQLPWRVDIGSYARGHDTRSRELSPALAFLALSFDYCRPHFDLPATKRQLREYLEWLATHPDVAMPFTIEELFGEKQL